MDPGPAVSRDLTPPQRGRVLLFSALFMAFVLSPLALSETEDGFPLSRYPMFSERRPPRESLAFATAELADGSRRFLGVRWWTDAGLHMGRNQLVALEGSPPAVRRAFCAELLAKIAASHEPWASDLRRVRIARGAFNRDSFARTGELRPQGAVTLAQCSPGARP